MKYNSLKTSCTMQKGNREVKDKSKVKEFGEVFTPPKLIERIFKHFPTTTWIDSNSTWLEPSCGNGNFLLVVYNNLMTNLKLWQPDDQMRHEHIIDHMLYGIDIQQDNVDLCVKRLNAGHLKHHIVCADALTYHYRFDEWEKPKEEPFESLFIWPDRK